MIAIAYGVTIGVFLAIGWFLSLTSFLLIMWLNCMADINDCPTIVRIPIGLILAPTLVGFVLGLSFKAAEIVFHFLV